MLGEGLGDSSLNRFVGLAPCEAWGFTPGGHVDGLQQQQDPYLPYAPDALGRPTRVSDYATSVVHHPNGQVEAYRLGNGISRGVSFNARGLPDQRRDIGVLWDRYTWDADGNVTAIDDLQWASTSRSLGYDSLNRLTTANGPWGTGSFTYDALDNLRSSTIGSRSFIHQHDAGNRLATLTGPTQSVAFGYDANGNITSRNSSAATGANPQPARSDRFVFDIGNRLQSVAGRATHTYDGHGRRAYTAYADGSWQWQLYDHAGRLRYTHHSQRGATRHVYLGSQLIAETSSATGHHYIHTDALGSPVARTNPAAQITSRTVYEPYGATAAVPGSTAPVGIGFTGHANDAESALVYMQQRYYDPIAGRFLSNDPVTTSQADGSSFNRYAYAAANPYGFVDPDGRTERSIAQEHQNCQQVAAGPWRAGCYTSAADSDSLRAAAPPAQAAGAPALGPASSGDLQVLHTVVEQLIAVFPVGRVWKVAKGVSEVSSLANAARLRGQLAGKEIAGGHAFEKHVLNQGEFKGLGIRTREQFANHIENVVNNPTASRQLSGGRSAYWQESTGTVVIRNPRAADGGTAFQPTNGRAYFDGLR